MGKRFIAFALTFVALFALTYAFMAMMDALPEPVSTHSQEESVVEAAPAASAVAETPELPTRVVAKTIGLDIEVLNPDSTDIEVLDEALLEGSVRYPGSAMLGVNGTVLLFGHSSYLPVVFNQNFKAFNGIQKLKTGETVSVYSATAEYRYQVTGVRLANAEEDVVELPANGKFLTLVTCDSFGKKTERFVVTAEFLGAYEL